VRLNGAIFWSCFSHCPGKFSADTVGSMFLSIAQRHRKGGKWGHAPWAWGAGLGGTSIHFIQTFKTRVFQQKFRAKYALKMRIFWNKGCKIAAAPRGSATEPQLASGSCRLHPQTMRCYLI